MKIIRIKYMSEFTNKISCLFLGYVFLFFSCSSKQEKMNEMAYDGDLQSFQKNVITMKTVNFQDERGWTPLMAAAENNQLGIIDFLIKERSYLDIQNESGDTALMRSVYMNHTKAAEKLILAGASLKIRDNGGFTPFLKAIEKGRLEMAMLLAKEKSDFKDRTLNPVKKTALHLAVKKGNLELIKWLLENGSDINAKDEDGRSPLMDSIIEKQLPIAKLLIEKGASTSEISLKGDTISSLARQTFNTDIIIYIDNLAGGAPKKK
jgi:ankyrin repeat protein